ncbi:MAG: glycosyltransferase, partial [Caldilineaceae bacterium]|nr:glycosyltransferase [Caldilineaceae bacterium]
MKLLIITTNFPRWDGDPHSPWLVELLGLLRAEDVQIEILAPSYAGLRDQVIHDMPVHRFRYAPARWETLTHEDGAPAKIRRNPLYLLLLPVYVLAGLLASWQVARRTHFDVLHVHWPVPQGLFGLVARAATRGRRPRLVATYYGADLVLAQRFGAVTPFLRWFTRRCDDVAAISSYTRRELVRLTGAQPRTIPYGIALPPAHETWPTQPGKILTVGRLIPRKGIRFLVEAMDHLRSHPTAHLTIIGGGPEREALEALITQLRLDDRVTFAGRVSDEELEEHYRTCDVFVLPAIVDSTGDTEMLG